MAWLKLEEILRPQPYPLSSCERKKYLLGKEKKEQERKPQAQYLKEEGKVSRKRKPNILMSRTEQGGGAGERAS